MSTFAELVVPAVRWDEEKGFEPARPDIERALELGVGGFVLFGGEREALRRLTAELRSASRVSLLVASDLERGAGQQVRGLTQLPPSLALADIGEAAVAEAAQMTAREARDVGINWVLAPVADLDVEPDNPIVQTRSFSADPDVASQLVYEWVLACQTAGVPACAKHFPGHGRTTADSHAELPVVTADRVTLEADLLPFRRAVSGGVASVMTAHVAFSGLDPGGLPATYSASVLRRLLRGELGFGGLVVTDALIMAGAVTGFGEEEAAVRAIGASCDLLLYPRDAAAVALALERAAPGDPELARRVTAARERRRAVVDRAKEPERLADDQLAAHSARADELALQSLRVLRGEPSVLRAPVEVAIVDDDAGGPYSLPPRGAFADALREAGLEAVEAGPGREGESATRGGRHSRVVLLFADVKSWKGRSRLSEVSRKRLAALLERRSTVVLFGHPRRIEEIPGDHPILCAWNGDVLMQRAAARWLTSL
jgi:beta-glucosidase